MLGITTLFSCSRKDSRIGPLEGERNAKWVNLEGRNQSRWINLIGAFQRP